VICAGFGHGLSLLAPVLRDAGAGTVAMEDPCLPVHRTLIAGHGLAVAPLPVDDAGARTDRLDAIGAGAVIVTPAHQYPTGVTLQPGRRAALVVWARREGACVIEDDYDGEFRFDRQPVGAVQGLAPDQVVYAGTVSKTLAPGVRLGWLVLPPRLVDPVVAMNGMARGGWTPPVLEQLTLAELIVTGRFDAHLRRLRAAYRARRDTLLAALADLPGARPRGIAAGLHLLVLLPRRATTEAGIRARAEARGIALAYLGPHRHRRGDHRPGVVIGFARPPASRFDRSVREAVDVLRSALAGQPAQLP
jgi:GntR family transcriptional regulator / MocR family aminotransferase